MWFPLHASQSTFPQAIAALRACVEGLSLRINCSIHEDPDDDPEDAFSSNGLTRRLGGGKSCLQSRSQLAMCTRQFDDGGSPDKVVVVKMERYVLGTVEVDDVVIREVSKDGLKWYFATELGGNA
jgi:hypothetical protein